MKKPVAEELAVQEAECFLLSLQLLVNGRKEARRYYGCHLALTFACLSTGQTPLVCWAGLASQKTGCATHTATHMLYQLGLLRDQWTWLPTTLLLCSAPSYQPNCRKYSTRSAEQLRNECSTHSCSHIFFLNYKSQCWKNPISVLNKTLGITEPLCYINGTFRGRRTSKAGLQGVCSFLLVIRSKCVPLNIQPENTTTYVSGTMNHSSL